MLDVVFAGYDGPLNRAAAHTIAQHANLAGCVWIKPQARWHKSWKGRVAFFRKRVTRRGLFKTLDELGYFLYHHATDRRAWSTKRAYELVDEYFAAAPDFTWPPQLYTENINAPEVLSFIERIKPDAVFSHCLNQYFGRKLRSATPLGIFMWHDGITPEYRGLYSPFWTLYEGDLDNLGCTLLRVNDELDAGEIYLQTRIADVDVERDNHVLIEHKALLAGLRDLGPFMSQLEAGTARPLERRGARDGYYSYPGITDLIVQRWRIRRLKRRLRRTPTVA